MIEDALQIQGRSSKHVLRNFCVCMGDDQYLKVKDMVKASGRCKNMCATRYLLRRPVSTAVAVGFDCDVVSCKLARRGVRCGAAEASARQGVVTRPV